MGGAGLCGTQTKVDVQQKKELAPSEPEALLRKAVLVLEISVSGMSLSSFLLL